MSSVKLTYCPVCGDELVLRETGGRLRPVCDSCGFVHYHNPVPGVGLLIEIDGGIVLIQRGNPPHQGEWTIPGGFIEADESAEEAAIREAEEETGLRVEIVEMMGVNSFPEGPPVSGIMIFYRMKPVAGTLHAGDDASDVRVFAPEDVPLLPFRTHREIMAEWLERFHSGQKTNGAAQRTTAGIRIRLMEVADTEHVCGLLAMIPANRHLSDEQWHDVILRMRESTQVEVFVAESMRPQPMIVGCLALSLVRGLTEGIGLINDMAVLPTYQRRGIGAELLEAAMRRADQLRLGSLVVNTQRANDQARAFLAAVGFSDSQMMRLKLSEVICNFGNWRPCFTGKTGKFLNKS
jgi:8-oxo-dGTP diphosphatase